MAQVDHESITSSRTSDERVNMSSQWKETIPKITTKVSGKDDDSAGINHHTVEQISHAIREANRLNNTTVKKAPSFEVINLLSSSLKDSLKSNTTPNIADKNVIKIRSQTHHNDDLIRSSIRADSGQQQSPNHHPAPTGHIFHTKSESESTISVKKASSFEVINLLSSSLKDSLKSNTSPNIADTNTVRSRSHSFHDDLKSNPSVLRFPVAESSQDSHSHHHTVSTEHIPHVKREDKVSTPVKNASGLGVINLISSSLKDSLKSNTTPNIAHNDMKSRPQIRLILTPVSESSQVSLRTGTSKS